MSVQFPTPTPAPRSELVLRAILPRSDAQVKNLGIWHMSAAIAYSTFAIFFAAPHVGSMLTQRFVPWDRLTLACILPLAAGLATAYTWRYLLQFAAASKDQLETLRYLTADSPVAGEVLDHWSQSGPIRKYQVDAMIDYLSQTVITLKV